MAKQIGDDGRIHDMVPAVDNPVSKAQVGRELKFCNRQLKALEFQATHAAQLRDDEMARRDELQALFDTAADDPKPDPE